VVRKVSVLFNTAEFAQRREKHLAYRWMCFKYRQSSQQWFAPSSAVMCNASSKGFRQGHLV